MAPKFIVVRWMCVGSTLVLRRCVGYLASVFASVLRWFCVGSASVLHTLWIFCLFFFFLLSRIIFVHFMTNLRKFHGFSPKKGQFRAKFPKKKY